MAKASVQRPAARLLLIEADALGSRLESVPPADFDRPTVCEGWSVRDVLAHCGAALTMTARDELHGFSPEENEQDVVARRPWPIGDVLDELASGYVAGAAAIEAGGGSLDGIGLGVWIHGGDVRDALRLGAPYTSEGVDLAVTLLLERSAARGKRPLDVYIGDTRRRFGVGDPEGAVLETDLETFVRLCGGRRPDPSRYRLAGADAQELVLYF